MPPIVASRTSSWFAKPIRSSFSRLTICSYVRRTSCASSYLTTAFCSRASSTRISFMIGESSADGSFDSFVRSLSRSVSRSSSRRFSMFACASSSWRRRSDAMSPSSFASSASFSARTADVESRSRATRTCSRGVAVVDPGRLCARSAVTRASSSSAWNRFCSSASSSSSAPPYDILAPRLPPRPDLPIRGVELPATIIARGLFCEHDGEKEPRAAHEQVLAQKSGNRLGSSRSQQTPTTRR